MKFPIYAQKNISHGKIKNKNSFKVGERVLIYRPKKSGKLSTNWITGYKIERKFNEDGYMVSNGSKLYRVNRTQIRKDFFSPRE